jgi:acyl-CoA synthetase (AMP-forming)/AMP-acid ligase II
VGCAHHLCVVRLLRLTCEPDCSTEVQRPDDQRLGSGRGDADGQWGTGRQSAARPRQRGWWSTAGRLRHDRGRSDPGCRPCEIGRRCSTGQVGKLWVHGSSVAAGDWANPTASAEVFGREYLTTSQPTCEPADPGFSVKMGRSSSLGVARECWSSTVGRCGPKMWSQPGWCRTRSSARWRWLWYSTVSSSWSS